MIDLYSTLNCTFDMLDVAMVIVIMLQVYVVSSFVQGFIHFDDLQWDVRSLPYLSNHNSVNDLKESTYKKQMIKSNFYCYVV